MRILLIKIVTLALVLVSLFFLWRWYFEGNPFSKATEEVCCFYPDDQSYSYILGFDCINSMPPGEVVGEDRCFDYLKSIQLKK